MAEALFLVRKTVSGGAQLVNGVVSVLVNDDTADSLTLHIASAVAACNAVFPKDADGSDPYPVGYFDTADEVSDLTSGILKDDTDAIVFTERGTLEFGT